MSDQFTIIRDHFLAALERPALEDQLKYADEHCGDTPGLRDKLVEMLRAHHQPDGFLASEIEPVHNGLLTEQPADPEAQATQLDHFAGPRAGTTIGPYKLREQIGEGGFGIVYVAEQEQPVARKVALKIIRPGMDSRDIIARFEAERQALAMMDHPNIAKVHDGGTTDSGRPYFVMELVKGIPITDFCDAQKLTTRERLELFIDVCRAVQHAHQKGIIHRDLKPSNVMVTLSDSRPMVKVIDFGISKALSQKLTEKTVYTAYGQMVGTPLYMSPEQAALSIDDVDTRSDVYSLGVLLYELLTGTTPFEKETLKTAGFDEFRRLLRDVDPPRPSARLSTLNAEALSTVSANRRFDPRKLGQHFRGELDWIVMHALEKDRTRRYESASAFAADIQRYLDDEPVQACPPSLSYRLRKFGRRNKAVMVTTVLVAASLVAGAAVSLWQAHRAIESERLAEQRLKHSEHSFAQSLQAIDRMLTHVSEELGDTAKLTQFRQTLLEDALELCEDLLKDNPNDPRVRFQAARIRFLLSYVKSQLGRQSEANSLSQEAYSALDRLLQEEPANPQYRKSLSDTCRQLAWNSPDRETQLASSRKAIALLEGLVDQYPARDEYKPELVDAYGSLGHRYVGYDHRTAAENLERSIKLGELVPNLAWGRVATTYAWYAQLLRLQHKLPQAAQAFRKAIATFKNGLDTSTDDIPPRDVQHYRIQLAMCYSAYGAFLTETSETELAEQALQTSVRQLKQLNADFPSYSNIRIFLAQAQSRLVQLLIGTGHSEDAALIIREFRPQTADEFLFRGRALETLQKYDAALEDYAKAIAMGPANSTAFWSRAQLHHRLANWERAIPDYTAAIELNPNQSWYYIRRAQAYQRLGRYAEAIVDLDHAREHSSVDSTTPMWLANTYLSLSQDAAAHKHDPQQIEQLLRKAIEIANSLKDPTPAICGTMAISSRTLSARGDFHNALRLAQWAHKKFPSRYFPYAALCEAKLGLHRDEEALLDIETAIKFAPQESWLYKRRALAHFRLGQYGEALADITQAVEIKPDDGSNLYWILPEEVAKCPNTSLRDGLLKLANRAIEQADVGSTRYGRGTLLLGLGRTDEAIADFEQAIKLEPKLRNTVAWHAVRYPVDSQDLTSRAVQWAQQAVEHAPDDGSYWNTLGVAQYRAGKPADAIHSLQKSIELSHGGLAFDFFFLAMAHAQLGQKEEARRWYDKAVTWTDENQPNDKELTRFRTEAQQLIGSIQPPKPKPNRPPPPPFPEPTQN